MRIVKDAIAGTLESSDCLIMVKPHKTLEIHLDSVVEKRFGRHIRNVINQILSELEVESGIISITDRGALDYCLKARLTTAVRRGGALC